MAKPLSAPGDSDGRLALRIVLDLMRMLVTRGALTAEEVSAMLSHSGGKALDAGELDMADVLRRLAGLDWTAPPSGTGPMPRSTQDMISAIRARASSESSGAAAGTDAAASPPRRTKGSAPSAPKKPRRRI